MSSNIERLKDALLEWERVYARSEGVREAISVVYTTLEELRDWQRINRKQEDEVAETVSSLLGIISDANEWKEAQALLQESVGRSQVSVLAEDVIRIDIMGDIRVEVKNEETQPDV